MRFYNPMIQTAIRFKSTIKLNSIRSFATNSPSTNNNPTNTSNNNIPYINNNHTPVSVPAALNELLIGYYPTIILPVNWGDQDLFGHVNNVIYGRYCESARIELFRAIQSQNNTNKSISTAFINYLSAKSIGPILKSLYIKYKFPLTYPDSIIIGSSITDIEFDRYTIAHRIISTKHSLIAAEGAGVIVSYNYQQRTKAETPELIQSTLKQWSKLYPGSNNNNNNK